MSSDGFGSLENIFISLAGSQSKKSLVIFSYRDVFRTQFKVSNLERCGIDEFFCFLMVPFSWTFTPPTVKLCFHILQGPDHSSGNDEKYLKNVKYVR
jgi:hypothetical protein